MKPVESSQPVFSTEALPMEWAWPDKELLPEDVQEVYRQIEGRLPVGMVLAPIDILDDWETDGMDGHQTTVPLNDQIEAFHLALTNAQEVVGVSRFGRARTWLFFHAHRRTLAIEVYGVVDGIEGRAHNILIQHLGKVWEVTHLEWTRWSSGGHHFSSRPWCSGIFATFDLLLHSFGLYGERHGSPGALEFARTVVGTALREGVSSCGRLDEVLVRAQRWCSTRHAQRTVHVAGLGGKGQVRKSRVFPKEQQESSRLEEARSKGKRQSTIMEFFSRKRRVVESTSPRSGESDGAAATNVDPPPAESDCRVTGSRPGEDTAPFDDGLLTAGQWRMQHAISPGSRIVSWNVGLQGYWSIRHELVTIVEQCCPSLIFLQDLKISLRDRKKVVRSCHKVVPLYKVYLVGGPDPLSSAESPLPFSLMILAHRTLCTNPSRELSSKLGFAPGEWKVGSGRLLIVSIPARHGCREVILINVYQRTGVGRGDVLAHIRRIGEWSVTQRQAAVILVGDLNASREGRRMGYVDGSTTMEYDKQLAEFYSMEIGGARWQAASTLSNQLSYHSPDGSHSAQLDDIWVLNGPSSMLHDDFHMAVRRPTSQVYDHWILDARIPAGLLPPHLPSARLGREARKVVDMERWRATLDEWKKSVFQSIPSGVDLDPIENLVTLAEGMHKHLPFKTLPRREEMARRPYENKTVRRLSADISCLQSIRLLIGQAKREGSPSPFRGDGLPADVSRCLEELRSIDQGIDFSDLLHHMIGRLFSAIQE